MSSLVVVCPTRDVECGQNAAAWCAACSTGPAPAGAVCSNCLNETNLSHQPE